MDIEMSLEYYIECAFAWINSTQFFLKEHIRLKVTERKTRDIANMKVFTSIDPDYCPITAYRIEKIEDLNGIKYKDKFFEDVIMLDGKGIFQILATREPPTFKDVKFTIKAFNGAIWGPVSVQPLF